MTITKVAAVQKLLSESGLDPERVQMFNLSSAMGPRFAEIALEMTATIQRLGPSPIEPPKLFTSVMTHSRNR